MPEESELLEPVEVEDDAQEDEVQDDPIEDKDDEFEYDEEGNIIIPDVVEEEPEADPDPEAEVEEEEEAPEVKEEHPNESEELARLRNELFLLKSQTKDTLEKWGVKTDDIMDGLAKIAAEEEGLSVEEYKKSREQAIKKELEEQKAIAEANKRIYAQDLQELKQAFPELSNLTDIKQVPNFAVFSDFRSKNLTAKQAYAAANPDGLRKNAASAANKQNLKSTKSHLKSNVPSKSSDGGKPMMTRGELSEWRSLFPDKSDKEIIQLYRDTIDK